MSEGGQAIKGCNIAPFVRRNLRVNKINRLAQIVENDQIVASSDFDLALQGGEKSRHINLYTRPELVPEFCDEKSKNFDEVGACVSENVSIGAAFGKMRITARFLKTLS